MKEKISKIKSAYSEYFKEREDEINGALLAVFSGENIIYLGPPGTAKTHLANKICSSIEGTSFFYYLLTQFTTPDEVFGPLSLKALEKDEFRRNIEGCLPKAHIALLDEIFKANSSILNSLLTILNERKFHNGKTLIDVPLLSVFGASNELPEKNENLEALYDRFLFRYCVNYIQNEENFLNLINGNSDFVSPVTLKLSEIQEVRKESIPLPMDDEVLHIITSLRKELNSHSIQVSDRRWKKIVQCLKVASSANGQGSVNKSMLLLLQHILWDKPEQKASIRQLLVDAIVSGGINLMKLQQEIDDLKIFIEKETFQGSNKSINTTVCVDCKKEFKKIHSLADHYSENPDHKYSIPSLNRSANTFDETMKILGFQIEKIETPSQSSNEKMIRRELSDIKIKFKKFKKSVDTESEHLKNDINNNIWLSRKDRDDVLINHEKKIKDLYALDNQISDIEKKICSVNDSYTVLQTRAGNYDGF